MEFAELIAVLSAVAAVISSAASLFLANLQSKQFRSAEVERRKDTFIAACQRSSEVKSESDICASLVEELQLGYDTLFAFAGGGKSSRLELYKRRLAQSMDRMREIRDRLDELAIPFNRWQKLDYDDVADRVSRLNSNYAEVFSCRLNLERELESIRQQISEHRQTSLGSK